MVPAKCAPATSTGKVYCPVCTHTVDATVEREPKRNRGHDSVKPGQKCPHCAGSLDAGHIMDVESAA
jgi:uncharacterized Zn finger protein (UPF0148 family)